MRLPALVRRDPEARALRALADGLAKLPPKRRPDDELQVVVDLARELTKAKYGALAVTDESDRTLGFVVSGLDDRVLKALRTPPQGHGPLGSLREDGRPVRYENVEEHSKAFGFPPKHPEMRRMMGVALWAHGSVSGSLYITDRIDDRQFDDADELVLTTRAKHASKVIERDWY